jgi:hypothetical protein
MATTASASSAVGSAVPVGAHGAAALADLLCDRDRARSAGLPRTFAWPDCEAVQLARMQVERRSACPNSIDVLYLIVTPTAGRKREKPQPPTLVWAQATSPAR